MSFKVHIVTPHKYLGIIRSHEVAEIPGRNADVERLSSGQCSTLDHVQVSADVIDNLPDQTSPVDGVGNSVQQYTANSL